MRNRNSKKMPYPILGVFAILFIFVGCKKKNNNENTYNSGYIKIAVDESMKRVMDEEIYVFESMNPAIIDAIYTSESEAIDLLKKDSVRLVVASRKLSSAEEQYFHKKNFYPKSFRVALDAVAFITNPANKDSIAEVNQIKDILSGKIEKWGQLDRKSTLGKVQLVFDNTQSGVLRYAIDSILRDTPLTKGATALKNSEEVVNYVAKVPNAIGVIGVSLISSNQDSTSLDFIKKIQVMRIYNHEERYEEDAVQPYQYYMYTHEYPFIRDIYIILNDPRGELPKGFSRFITSDDGQRIIKRAGLLPSTMPISTVQITD